MELLDEIIALLSSEKPSLVNALYKAQVLAHMLKEPEIKAWVEHELRGYKKDEEIPTYRILKSGVFGTISNGQYTYKNFPIPILDLDKSIQPYLLESKFPQSISVLERLCIEGSTLKTVLPPETYGYLSKALDSGYFVQNAWTIPSAGSLEQVLAEVRYRLLNFALELSEKDPLLTQKQNNPKGTHVVNEIFKNTVIGDNATIVVGSGSIHGVRNSISTNDFEGVAKILLSNGMNQTDIDELRAAIDSDKSISTEKQESIGSNVKQWTGKMLLKAGTASWNITTEAAGNLLAAVIASYYGFSK